MSSSGLLVKSVQAQISRMITELKDLESAKQDGDLTDEEYLSAKAEAEAQLAEFKSALEKLTLKSEVEETVAGTGAVAGSGAVQLAKNNDIASLRLRLSQLESSEIQGKISREMFYIQGAEIVNSLLKLRALLTSQEEAILKASQGRGGLVSGAAGAGVGAGAAADVAASKVMGAVRDAL
jgi:hypothetical protein